MDIIKLNQALAAQVLTLTMETIKECYPKYYPVGAVDFFLKHHELSTIIKDIDEERVYGVMNEGQLLGTISIHQNEIYRLFVLPSYQGQGIGHLLMNFGEGVIAKSFSVGTVDSSLPGKTFYLKRGYREMSYHTILTENGDFLCYDVMEKRF
ncbi:GNAT family N-acetyltransferase [Enterococcus sp. LJL128]|uniref:GNAT family N-acetyltransferase n=1 Tax=Enterococcus sp. LJL51 TaxID=3416656 RepID=UPI003CEB8BAF